MRRVRMDSWVLTSQTADRVEVRIKGDIDLGNSSDLAEFLELLITSSHRTEVNLAELEFIDSNGLAALLTAHRIADEHRAEFVLVAPNERVQRLFELSGCAHIFTVVADTPRQYADN
jgi:anti-sigma B factor antagonist